MAAETSIETAMPDRREACRMLAGLAGLATAGRAMAQSAAGYPDKPVQFVINFAAGGATDINGRLIAKLMSEKLGQPFVVENRAGAAGAIGAGYVTHARPDGSIIGISGLGPTVLHTLLGRKLNFDPVKDLTPVAFLGSSSMAFVARPGTSLDTLQKLIAAARAEPGRISYGTAGNGTPGHLAGEYMAGMAGVKLVHVPYKGDSELLPDLMSGRLDFASVGMVSVFPQLKANRLAGIAITTKERLKSLPDLRTVSESGLPDYEAETWNLLVVPKGTPPEIGRKLNAVVNAITADPAYNDALLELGSVTRPMTQEQMQKFVVAERAKWARVIQEAHITAPD